MYRRILIPTDGSACSEPAIDHGLELAATFGAEVVFVHAVEAPLELAAEAAPYAAQLYHDLRSQGREILDAAQRRAQEHELTTETRLVERSAPVQAILEAENECDLIVMGTHGRRGFDRFMFGSVAEEVLRRAVTPCLLIHSRADGLGTALRDELEGAADRIRNESGLGTTPP